MRKRALILIVSLLVVNQVYAQDTTYTFLGEFFEQSYIHPDHFSWFVLVNSLEDNFDKDFWSCHEAAMQEFGPRGEEHMSYCRQQSLEQYNACVARNQAGLLTYWLITIRTVLKGDTLQWSETRLGSSLIAAQEDQNSIEVLGNLLGAGGVIKDSKEIANKYIQGISKTLYCNYKR